MKVTVNGSHHFELENNQLQGSSEEIDIQPIGRNSFHIIRNGRSWHADVVSVDETAKNMVIRVDGSKYTIAIKDRFDALLEQLGMEDMAGSKIEDLKAPMPGLVLDIMTEAGQQVSKGDPVLILEAMKMENVLKAPGDGTVESIAVGKGDAVEKNQLLIKMAG